MKRSSELTSQEGQATLVRPIYSPGLLLEDEDLTAGIDYTRDLTRLLFRSLFGCGVICGLTVKATADCNGRRLEVVVKPGLGLDCLGNPIQVKSRQRLVYDPECEDFPREIWVAACYAYRCCQTRDVACADDDDPHVVHTRIRDWFKIKLYAERPKCICSCEPPAPADDGGTDNECCGSEQRKQGQQQAEAQKDQRTSDAQISDDKPREPPFDCYADHLNGVCACDCGCDCILIGKLTLTLDSSGGLASVAVDDSVVRRIRPMLIGQYLQQRNARGHA